MNAIISRRLRNLMLFIAILAAPTSLCAAESAGNFYAGLGVGVAQVSDDVFLFDDSSTAFKVLAGYQINEHLSFEGSFVTLDDYESYYPFVFGTQHAVADGRGFSGVAVVTMPLTERFDLRARGGILFWKADTDVASIESSGNDLSFGLGVNFRVNETLGIRLDYDALKFGDVEANVATAAFEYRF